MQLLYEPDQLKLHIFYHFDSCKRWRATIQHLCFNGSLPRLSVWQLRKYQPLWPRWFINNTEQQCLVSTVLHQMLLNQLKSSSQKLIHSHHKNVWSLNLTILHHKNIWWKHITTQYSLLYNSSPPQKHLLSREKRYVLFPQGYHVASHSEEVWNCPCTGIAMVWYKFTGARWSQTQQFLLCIQLKSGSRLC